FVRLGTHRAARWPLRTTSPTLSAIWPGRSVWPPGTKRLPNIAAPVGRSVTRLPIMPKRTDIKTILILGSGPIVIGQGCEFDYSGTQACKALRSEGFRVVLVNSNPATIMTDPEFSDRTYIEPITPAAVRKVIEKQIEIGD